MLTPVAEHVDISPSDLTLAHAILTMHMEIIASKISPSIACWQVLDFATDKNHHTSHAGEFFRPCHSEKYSLA